MCGIFGQISRGEDIQADMPRFERALHLLQHRGPDDWGISHDERHIFGHRRLSILDLSRLARQPMITEDENVIITYNGEVYNFSELKDELIAKGYRFKTNCDTEVLLNGFHHHGIDFITRCNGMFAFGIYDKRSSRGYLVRDRVGIKPLYYTFDEGRVTFASEVKAILAYRSEPSRLNSDVISSYVTYRYPILDDTFFEGIHSLPPGHFLEVSQSEIKIKKYWDPTQKFLEQEEDRGEGYYLTKLRELTDSAVTYRMIADVPVGSYLSGGADSSIVTAIMAQKKDDPVNTFVIGFEEEGYNEFPYSEMMAELYDTHHHEIVQTGDDYFEVLDRMISFKDAPLSIPNEVALHQLSCEMRKHVTVALSGNGSDELFCGYGRIFRSAYDYDRMKGVVPLDSGEKDQFIENFEAKYGTKSFETPLDHFLSQYGYTSLQDKRDLLSQDLNLGEIELEMRARFQDFFDEVPNNDYLSKINYVFTRLHLPGILLYQDATTMATSLEVRVPFVDHRIVEFAFALPEKYKLRWLSKGQQAQARTMTSDQISESKDIPKYLLKKAYEREVPEEILYRKKMGFPVPLSKLFGGKMLDRARDLLLSKTAQERGIYNSTNIGKWLNSDASTALDQATARKIWMLYNIETFMQKYF